MANITLVVLRLER